jgi:hypothetical protein
VLAGVGRCLVGWLLVLAQQGWLQAAVWCCYDDDPAGLGWVRSRVGCCWCWLVLGGFL